MVSITALSFNPVCQLHHTWHWHNQTTLFVLAIASSASWEINGLPGLTPSWLIDPLRLVATQPALLLCTVNALRTQWEGRVDRVRQFVASAEAKLLVFVNFAMASRGLVKPGNCLEFFFVSSS